EPDVLQRLQRRAQHVLLRPLHAARDQAEAAVVFGQQLQQQARLAPGASVEDVGEFGVVAHQAGIRDWGFGIRKPESGRSVRCAALPESRIPNPESRLLIPQRLQRRLVVRPAGAHAYPGLEEHLAVEQTLHRLPRPGADLAQARAALADDDRLLALALDPD